MGVLLQNLSLANKNGGNYAIIVQAKVSGGHYITATAADVFGDAAATAQVLGSFQDSDMKRQTDGSRILNCTVMEQDLIRHNFLELVAPASGIAPAADLIEMEDGINSVGSSNAGTSFDATKPVFALFHFLSPLAGVVRCRHAFVQFKPEGGHDGAKSKQWNTHKFSAYTIDAAGSPAFTLPSDPIFATLTAHALVAPFQHGKVIDA